MKLITIVPGYCGFIIFRKDPIYRAAHFSNSEVEEGAQCAIERLVRSTSTAYGELA